MTREFSILPWEFRGSEHDEAAHAQTELDIGGKTRTLLLKMRDGIIYFKEPSRTPVWAVTRVFERELRGDELVEAWRLETERENYGRMLVYAPNFPDAPGNVVLAIIARSDFSGWVIEWQSSQWLETPPHRDGKTLDIWGTQFQNAKRRAFRHALPTILDSALPASQRLVIPLQWARGSKAELQRMFSLVMRLFTWGTPDAELPVRLDQINSARDVWQFSACNPRSAGGFLHTFNSDYYRHLFISPHLGAFVSLLEQEFVLNGMAWRKGAHNSFKAVQTNPSYAPFIEKWGDDWRGFWKIETPSIILRTSVSAPLSAHEKLEALLELSEWLSDKASPKQRANLLRVARK